MKKLKDLITKKYKFWYIIFSTSGVLMLLNTEILSEFIPFWATCIINSVILVADVLYAKVLVVHLKEKTFKYVNKKQVEIQKFVQEKITEAENSINANIEKEAITIISSINVNAGEIKNNVNKNSLSLEESINKLKEIENEHNSLVCVRIEESSKKNEQILKISTDLLNDKIAELDNNEANRRDEARGELKQIIKSVEQSLIETDKENLEELKSEVEKANVEIKKTLGDMSTSNEENKEQVENILQEMSVATNNKLLEMNEGITSRITEYSDKLNNSLETLETSDIERENRIKEIIQKVSDEQIKKIANKLEVLFEEQSDNVNTIIDTVNASIVQFNEELVKQSNAIQDLNDENTNFVTEKYNRVFEQIRVFSKDSKATLKNVKLAIDNNKDSIEKSEKKITNYIENYFNTIDDKAKEIDSLKNIVKRNYDIFNEQLEFTHNQLDSLNSLASIIKKMAEKPEKSEKVEEKKSDRVELIKDSETGLDVKNTYKNNMLKQSSMFKGQRKVYDVEYGQKGEILKTKNYDQKGNLSIEMAYYANGQVKERREYISGKAEISKFDINGKKIN